MAAGALVTDAAAWASGFGIAHDSTGLACEQNVLRYRTVPATVRFEHERLVALIRVVAAGVRAVAPVTVSAAALPEALVRHLKA